MKDKISKEKVPKIGKPQRSKKHKKLKSDDPFYFGDRKNRRTEGLNQKPKTDEQEIPKKVRMMMAGKGPYVMPDKQKKKERFQVERGVSRPMKPVPRFIQKKNENEEAFLYRVDRTTANVVARSQMEQKFEVDLDEAADGTTIVTKKKGLRKKEKLKERKLRKAKQKQEKKEEKKKDFNAFQDHVMFGETVHAPPSLTARPRKSKNDDSMSKPGKKTLLLKQIIQENSAHNLGSSEAPGKREIGQTVKRKHLSLCQQVKLDHERTRVIDLYRQLKSKQQKLQ
ncbi:coiled-coil domain-containing protein 137-like [Gigantopelta aegis]|uniref:coiled-coil domain-containing protein 137-like n=1 Tax=Gigantopelta aegis TaxID=1735272 RepID=UPI001B88C02D|nr:coiled-coil domain-containing protein 137-like [Gigantopelta aegis]